MREDDLAAAADAIRAGELVVFPTETVYGLGGDALDPDAIERVFEVKGRAHDDPLSLGVSDVETALQYTRPDERTRAFMAEFLPGPVTVVCEKVPAVPDELTGGRSRVGIRVPDHDLALAFFERAGPVTATSANLSGAGSVTRPEQLDSAVREAVAVVLDGGETPGLESTVVDPERGEVHRRGALADDIESWLAGRSR